MLSTVSPSSGVIISIVGGFSSFRISRLRDSTTLAPLSITLISSSCSPLVKSEVSSSKLKSPLNEDNPEFSHPVLSHL